MYSSYIYIWIACFGLDPERRLYIACFFFEAFFLIFMIIHFLTDFTREGENIPVSDIGDIAYHYFETDFLSDLIPLLPFSFFVDNGFHSFYRLLFCIKVIRVKTGLTAFDAGKIFRDIKDGFTKRLTAKIKKYPEIETDMFTDHNQMEKQMIIGYLLKSFKLVMIIFNGSYFLGMFWLIYCEVT